ncbi:MAG: hypothetical protein LBL05_01340 [Synergistaceae bacterium]|jgi:hypothetical protein|nr:hypothetical protein [Synergistaceae bacterium]
MSGKDDIIFLLVAKIAAARRRKLVSYVRQIIDSEKLSGIIDLPASLEHQIVEVLILPLGADSFAEHQRESVKSAFGCLARYAKPDLTEKEYDAWQNAARDKYDAAR